MMQKVENFLQNVETQKKKKIRNVMIYISQKWSLLASTWDKVTIIFFKYAV